jgi:type II secretory pathway pseudopilin PulG
MMTFRKIAGFLVIVIAAIVITVVGIRSYRNNMEQKKEQFLKALVENLESYKSLHGRYPPDLSGSLGKNPDWLYYVADSSGQNFFLTYSSGIMSVNSHRYSSVTGMWQEHFNY